MRNPKRLYTQRKRAVSLDGRRAVYYVVIFKRNRLWVDTPLKKIRVHPWGTRKHMSAEDLDKKYRIAEERAISDYLLELRTVADQERVLHM